MTEEKIDALYVQSQIVVSILLDDLADCLEEGISLDFGESPGDVPLRKISDRMRFLAAYRRKMGEMA